MSMLFESDNLRLLFLLRFPLFNHFHDLDGGLGVLIRLVWVPGLTGLAGIDGIHWSMGLLWIFCSVP